MFFAVLSLSLKNGIANSYFLSPLVCHLCTKSAMDKVEKINERTVLFISNYYITNYEVLLQRRKWQYHGRDKDY